MALAPACAGEPKTMLAEAAQTAPDKSQVIAALKQASVETGSDFHYLLGTAIRESGLKTGAQASTSSACGLFQFTGQTWLGLIRRTARNTGWAAAPTRSPRTAMGISRSTATPTARQFLPCARTRRSQP